MKRRKKPEDWQAFSDNLSAEVHKILLALSSCIHCEEIPVLLVSVKCAPEGFCIKVRGADIERVAEAENVLKLLAEGVNRYGTRGLGTEFLPDGNSDSN